jgi:transcriptional regulator with XRE-family HTH domain/quercetin dioxygenase-like cupin family protein
MTRPLHGQIDYREAFDLPDHMAARLRAGREQSGRSLRSLARAANVSASFISQIENRKAKPSVETLLAIVRALDMSLDELFSDARTRGGVSEAASPPPNAATVGGLALRATDRPRVDLAGGVRWERLTPESDPNVTFLYVTYGVGGASCPPGTTMQHAGREFGVVLGGHLGALIGGATYELGQGDSITFDCSTPHRFWTIGDEPAVGVWTIMAPAPDAARLGVGARSTPAQLAPDGDAAAADSA